MKDGYRGSRKSSDRWVLASLLAMLALFAHGALHAFTLNVVAPDGFPVAGYRYLVEVDTTNLTVPGAPVSNSISLDIHSSYAPPVTTGTSAFASTNVPVDNNGRYFVTVLPNAGFALGGAPVAVGQNAVTVIVNRHGLPTAQISVLAFVDHQPINNAWDEHDPSLGGAKVQIADFSGGALSQDAFGNLLGTTYQKNPDGSIVLDVDGSPVVDVPGTGNIYTLTQDQFNAGGASNPYNLNVGEALVKYLPPGKYGVTIVPPQFDDDGAPITWSQTTTIEGTPTIDAWVKANEPAIFIEGFGTGFKHVVFGFVKIAPTTASPYKGQVFSVLPWNATPAAGTGTIQGTLRSNHFARPPNNQGFFPGPPVPECWVGLNDPLATPGTGQPAGLVAVKCDGDSNFVINNVPPGTYQLVNWDGPLDYLFGTSTVTVGPGETVNLGDVLVFRWFGNLEGSVFFDTNLNGFRDPGETGIVSQAVNLRFRDGTVYQATTTDVTGEYALSEVFPFFKWLVLEVDFARFRATGMTAAIDYGGQIPAANGWTMPSFDALNPQPQVEVNPNTGNNLSRTETGPVLTQAMHLFLNQTNVVDWGKVPYPAGANGGISGIAYYDVTRAENDPRYNAPETWQPGVPRVQVCLYQDNDSNGIIDDINAPSGVQLCDVDNYPFGWSEGGAKGPEDVVRSGNGVLFSLGDALEVATTDSWDDNRPSGCIQTLPIIHGVPAPECADAYGTWNQLRPGLFDGGYAFGEAAGGVLAAGGYIVESVPPPVYEIVKEEDKNVDFGDPYTPSPLLPPPPCVGTVANGNPLHTVPAELSLFPGVPIDPPLAGSVTPLCNMKQVTVIPGQNTAADFYLFTMVPKAARAVGFVNNDLAAEFNMASPNFGEKLSPSWLPVSFKDWAGNEITRVYTDEFGGYNTLLPSTYSIYIPTPSGVSPNMITLVLNDPVLPDGTPDPYYNPTYGVAPWTLHYTPGTTTYLDTPIVPVAAFSSAGTALDTMPADLTPEIAAVAVTAPTPQAGPLVCAPGSASTITITSVGLTTVLNPAYVPSIPGTPFTITRDYGFGSATGTVTLDGTPLVLAGPGWTDTTITATVPAGSSTGRLMVTRGDNGFTTEVGATLLIDDCATFTVRNVPTVPYPSIQAAVDGSNPGDVIVVAPGHYNENVIMYKPVRLLGSGAGGTTINGNPNPLDRLQAWHDRIDALGGAAFEAFLLKPIFMENEASAVVVFGETIYPLGDIQAPDANCDVAHNVFNPLYCNRFNTGNPFNVPGQASIQNFTLSGSVAGGGIFAASGARHLMIQTNNVTGNQGNYAGGIDIGIPDNGFDNKNRNITVRRNKLHRNGGFQGAGGIAVCEYANDYLIEENLVIGNMSRYNGGGIFHRGLVPGNNVIRNNKVLFNEVFLGALIALAGDGAGITIGGDIVAGTGAGNVTIDRNLIQGNLTGSGYGGGIRAFSVNAEDITGNPGNVPPVDPIVDPPQWYQLRITNNIIVNNVAGAAGGGISLQDVYRPVILNNTIANNDSTATSRLAFAAGALNSTPQPAGIHSTAHSPTLQAALNAATAPLTDNTGFSNPQLVNNILWRNRSFFNNASLNGGAGGLSPNATLPYWDLGVTDTAGFMDPDDSILTSLIYGEGSNYTDGTNIAANPLFVGSYVNALEIATVTDEGGNNISVRFLPLVLTGDYHITAASPAVNAGQVVANDHDYDGDPRPRPSTAFDIGADEINVAGTVPPGTTSKIGVFRNGQWYLDTNGNGGWTPGTDTTAYFGDPGDVPVAGDWNGNGTTKIGVFRNGVWYLDTNGNGGWTPGTDTAASFGTTGDVPVAGDWNGNGTAKIGVFRNGVWYLDTNGNGAWSPDTVVYFGTTGDVPVVGDWNGTGTAKVGLFRNGVWYLDTNGNGAWDGGTDTVAYFGAAGDVPVIGDWDGTGTAKIGVFRNGVWYLDTNGNGAWDGGTDTVAYFGTTGDAPVTGKW